jgi:hypothetical protein
VQLEPGATHGCLNEPFTPEGGQALESIAGWLVKRG